MGIVFFNEESDCISQQQYTLDRICGISWAEDEFQDKKFLNQDVNFSIK